MVFDADDTTLRAYELGYNIVGNFGDSDLIGGFADHACKLPNASYYLP